ncbi:hypothetical protein ENUP19_0317G0088 [Entamoeba nuttalli]|uniref:Uncharacterized protein n=2 Tax=Entamoeba nuttalli TaxID=412467 RepID=K2G9U0_ENTNP|nr:hypothetical protein ENU1_138440 [Entamoeba nuttalli P19]EKE39181.1 hypothetical protein ENU1_138440 [Entamoeba nuttalli P19]|eukprot:XP_008858485.1 hypothetical protein ENU1_138440 [Entamoeba nuttalli P19]
MSQHKEKAYFKNYKDKINYQVSLQSIFIGLINRYAKIMLKRRTVKATVTKPFLCIEFIEFEETDTILFWEFIENMIKSMYNEDRKNNIKETTASERLKRNRIIYSIHLLEDILGELGFSFKHQTIKRKNGQIALEFVVGIFYDNSMIMMEEGIVKKGGELNQYFMKLLKTTQFVVIAKDNTDVQTIINT